MALAILTLADTHQAIGGTKIMKLNAKQKSLILKAILNNDITDFEAIPYQIKDQVKAINYFETLEEEATRLIWDYIAQERQKDTIKIKK